MADYYTYSKKRGEVGYRAPIFTNSEVKVMGFIPSQKKEQFGENHARRNPNFLMLDNIPEMSERMVNTERVTTVDRGMAHKEGGWPLGVDPTEPFETNRWRKKTERDPVYMGAVRDLVNTAEKCISQNNQIDLFEEYFINEESELFHENLSTKTLMLFKDQSKRSVSSIAYHPDGPTKLAVSYAVTRFQQMPQNMAKEAYIWDVNDPNLPDTVLDAPSPITTIAYNHKNTDQLAGGCYNGLVVYWDLKQKNSQVLKCKPIAEVEDSHYDPVTNLVWLSAKTGSEFVTTSTDGYMYWWDLRNPDKPTSQFRLSEGPIGPGGEERYVGGTKIEYLPDAGPTKYLVGTEQGSILTVNKRPKRDIDVNPRVGIDNGRHYGPITSLQRNPIHNKFFLSVGDWSVKIWNEDIKTPIVRTRYHSAYLSDGVWSPTRAGLFFVTRRDGWIDLWDYFYRQNEIAFTHKVSDTALTCIKINSAGTNDHPAGKYCAVGDQDGTVTLLELCDSLYIPIPKEKDTILEIFDRETKKEKNLEALKKQQDGRSKVVKENKAMKDWENKKGDLTKEYEETFFNAMGRDEDDRADDEGDKSDDEPQRRATPPKKEEAKIEEPPQKEPSEKGEEQQQSQEQKPEEQAAGGEEQIEGNQQEGGASGEQQEGQQESGENKGEEEGGNNDEKPQE